MLFHYEWFLWFCVKDLRGLVWKAFCFMGVNQVPCYLNSQIPDHLSLVQINHTVFKLSVAYWSFNFRLFSLWCSSGFVGCVFLVWYSWGKSMKYTLLFRDALFWVLFFKLVFFPATSVFYMVLDFTFMDYLFSLR